MPSLQNVLLDSSEQHKLNSENLSLSNVKLLQTNANCLISEDYLAIDKFKFTSNEIIHKTISELQSLKRTLYQLTLLDETEETKQLSKTISLLSTELKLTISEKNIDSNLIGFRNVAVNGNFEPITQDNQEQK